MRNSQLQPEEEEIISLKLPFHLPDDHALEKRRLHDFMDQFQTNKQHIEIAPGITISKKRLLRQLHEVTVARYKHKETGEVIERIEASIKIMRGYDYVRMADFCLPPAANRHHSLAELTKMLRDKILQGRDLSGFKFVPAPQSFLSSFNLSLPSTDLLYNKTDKKKADKVKSQSIGFDDPIPQPPADKPSPPHSELYQKLSEYFERRPCWLRNTLEYYLRQDGYTNKYTLTQLKNILKYLSYTFKDGPWKHTLCHFGYDPTKGPDSVKFQVVMIKIKQKGLEDYEQQAEDPEDEEAAPYDPTFKQIPSKFLRLYQVGDIESEFVKRLLEGVSISAKACSKQYGWFTKKQYLVMHKVLRSMREKQMQ